MDVINIIFIISLGLVAFLYSSVGHGGASGYIAMFALFGMISPSMKSFVLLMNLGVASVAFYQYAKHSHFNLKYFVPFGLGATPMAYFGASLKIDALFYRYMLAAFLIFSVIYLLGFFHQSENRFKINYSASKAFFIAALIGFISGVTGVGGGIFLSPILLLLAWGNVKQTAAIAALFIVLNSLAGLIAIDNIVQYISQDLLLKMIVVLGFGYLGSRWGVKIENTSTLKRMLAFVLLSAAAKLCLA